MSKRSIWIGIILVAGFAGAAGDPPDSRVSPATGQIETVDSVWNGTQYDVRYTVKNGPGQPAQPSWVTSDGSADLAPRIAGADDTWVVWWRDDAVDAVWSRKRDSTTKLWGNERRLSGGTESSRNPEIVDFGDASWVVYEYDSGEDTAVGVLSVVDEPEPVGTRTELAISSFSGGLDALIHVDDGHLWVTWVEDASDVGWSEYDATAGTWSQSAYEDYSVDSVQEARGRILAEITTP